MNPVKYKITEICKRKRIIKSSSFQLMEDFVTDVSDSNNLISNLVPQIRNCCQYVQKKESLNYYKQQSVGTNKFPRQRLPLAVQLWQHFVRRAEWDKRKISNEIQFIKFLKKYDKEQVALRNIPLFNLEPIKKPIPVHHPKTCAGFPAHGRNQIQKPERNVHDRRNLLINKFKEN